MLFQKPERCNNKYADEYDEEESVIPTTTTTIPKHETKIKKIESNPSTKKIQINKHSGFSPIKGMTYMERKLKRLEQEALASYEIKGGNSSLSEVLLEPRKCHLDRELEKDRQHVQPILSANETTVYKLRMEREKADTPLMEGAKLHKSRLERALMKTTSEEDEENIYKRSNKKNKEHFGVADLLKQQPRHHSTTTTTTNNNVNSTITTNVVNSNVIPSLQTNQLQQSTIKQSKITSVIKKTEEIHHNNNIRNKQNARNARARNMSHTSLW